MNWEDFCRLKKRLRRRRAFSRFFARLVHRPQPAAKGTPNRKTVKAMKEAGKIARDPKAKSYTVDETFMELVK